MKVVINQPLAEGILSSQEAQLFLLGNLDPHLALLSFPSHTVYNAT